jgi:hypothetical protein
MNTELDDADEAAETESRRNENALKRAISPPWSGTGDQADCLARALRTTRRELRNDLGWSPGRLFNDASVGRCQVDGPSAQDDDSRRRTRSSTRPAGRPPRTASGCERPSSAPCP